MLWSALLLGASSALAAVDWTATPFNPTSIPLAVRSPYLSTWLPGGANGGRLNGAWPTFWTGSITGWAGYVRVDGTAYTWLGAPTVAGSTLAVQKSATVTSTQSIYVLTAGGIDLTATFLSPIEATDYVRQSLPFSYLTVTVKSNDGKAHSVQVYSDISGEWVSGDSTNLVNWSTTVNSAIVGHQIQLQSPTTYGEANERGLWGSAYYGVVNSGAVTYLTAQDTVARAAFIANGKLANTADTAYRAINDRWPVLALSKDLGSTSDSTASPITFAVGVVRTPEIQYIVAGGSFQDRYGYWNSQYATPLAALTGFLSASEYSHAVTTAKAFDAKVVSDATKISTNYANILALSARQAMGAVEITISKTSSGGWNTTDILAFQKEISSSGNINTVDVIFPSWPFFLYVNPDLGRRLLEPLFAYQAAGLYPNKFAAHDLNYYPKATGHPNDEQMPVEESGNMLIMTLSYAQKTGDTTLISRYYTLLSQWTQFLISDSLIPANQLSTDDFAGSLANQTDLAIKGIVGIGAMAQIATRLGKTADATSFQNTATSYVTQMLKYATATTKDHLTLAYNSDASWGLTYNLYGDKLLKLNLFPASVYTMQTAWYASHNNAYGVLLDTRNQFTKTDWEIWTASIVTTTAVRDIFINTLAKLAADGQGNVPFPDLWDTVTGAVANGFKARPVVGGHFALLVL